MQRLATAMLALALLAPSLSVFAQEASSTEPAADVASTTISLPGEVPVTSDDLSVSNSQVFTTAISDIPLLSVGERFLINQEEIDETIRFGGASGGSYHPLIPAPVYVAVGTGPASKVRLYIAKSGDNSSPVLTIFVKNPDTGEHICTLFRAGNFVSPGPQNYEQIPFGEVPELVEFESPSGDCLFTEGSPYQFELSYAVNGDPRWTDGVLHFRGADAQSKFFLQIIAKDDTSACTENCHSNVLFLPGIKGSVLKSGSDTLWPADLWGEDIPALALTSEGESVNSVTVDGILERFATVEIYSGAVSFFDSLVADGTIKEWIPMPYDWRFSPEKILSEGIQTSHGTIDIVQSVEDLAATSATGKVTIVGHSMGGLMGKALIKKLENEGKAELIDNFVMIGTPQLGTPQAVGSLLHGDSEALLGGVITTAAEVRSMGRGMESAYNLLPSRKYLEKIESAPIKFSPDAVFTDEWRGRWGLSIDSYNEFAEFVTGSGVARVRPGEANILSPEVLDQRIFDATTNFHDTFDTYTIPSNIRVVQIAGWGLSTPKTVEYRTMHLIGIPPVPTQGYGVIPTVEGDGTVVYASALSTEAGESYFFDIAGYNELPDINDFEHKDMVSAPLIQQALRSVINSKNITESEFLLSTRPDVSEIESKLLIITRSPVVLGAYDQVGNFTGINPNQDLAAEFLPITKEIPGSSFFVAGGDNYLFLPEGGEYNFVIKGTGNGPATLEINSLEEDVVIPKSSYTDIPVTSTTNMGFVLNSTNSGEVFIDVDSNGDGISDETIAPDGYVPPPPPPPTLQELITVLKSKVQALNITAKLKANLLKKIEGIEKKVAKQKQNKSKVLANLETTLLRKAAKGKIDTISATELLTLVDELEAHAGIFPLDSTLLQQLRSKIQSLDLKPKVKADLLKRIARLERTGMLSANLIKLTALITLQGTKGKILDADVIVLIGLLEEIELAL